MKRFSSGGCYAEITTKERAIANVPLCYFFSFSFPTIIIIIIITIIIIIVIIIIIIIIIIIVLCELSEWFRQDLDSVVSWTRNNSGIVTGERTAMYNIRMSIHGQKLLAWLAFPNLWK